MRLGIMQPYLLPYIGYWQLLNAVDKYVIYDDVNYIKGGWINRNRILISKEIKYFTVKLNGASPNKLINEVEVSNDKIYKKKMLKTIEESYKKTPFFNIVFPIIKEIIENEEDNLAKYLKYSIEKICNYLEIKTELLLSSELEKDNSLKGKDKVISICKKLEATEYYNAIGGQELYSFEEFKDNGIELKFLKTEEIKYKQFNNEFISNLSILDVMMFNSKEKTKKFLNSYSLIGVE
ncbi:WbqC family protein [Fusobacterium sp.]|uniref:WbqC family protein n=1 Tax=Fusobacterium sp. TaxID=68766 RepID=UPI001D28B931|nr:WbqC family protein [Fusobacterium sp.]MBS5790285.1 WbqC family protein [Fusobacterium sp.]